VEVQVGQRAALAGHVDQVVGAAQQAKAALVQQVQDVGQRRGFGDVAAGDEEAFFAGAVFAPQPQLAQRRGPDLAVGGAARGHLAGFGAAVDLDQPACSCASASAASCGDSGAVADSTRSTAGSARPTAAGLQVEGRGDQRARPRHRSSAATMSAG
jgi:hypothetical protein